MSGNYIGSVTWSQWSDFVRLTALGLHELGIQKGDRIGILAENGPAWTYADLGGLTLGAVIVPVYPTLSSADLAFIIKNSGMKIIFVSTPEQYEKIRILGYNTSELKVITFYDQPAQSCISLSSLHEKARQNSQPGLIDSFLARTSGDDLATLIYTSGTTGVPKGVMLTHANFIENFRGASSRIQVSESDVALSFLPLSHVFERLAGYYFMAFSGAQIVYAESMLTVADDIRIVAPTVAAAVPRFYEKVYAAIQAKLQNSGPVSKKIFQAALSFRKNNLSHLHPNRKSGLKSLVVQFVDAVYDKLVFSKVRQGVGGRIRFFISGGAPLSRELAEFFSICGVLILEGYGLTETSPVIAVNTESEFKFGTVGKILPNVQVKIDQDGEILTAGPCVMRGYFNNPEATSEVLENGWFHTGDIGEFDAEGYLKITDRKKDLIVTAGGKKVAPQKLEGLVMRDPLFSQVVALGDKKPYIVALVVLNRSLASEGATHCGLSSSNFDAWIVNAQFCEWVFQKVQAQILEVARYESIKSIAIVPTEFSIQNGELTPTLKVKRRFVMEKYAMLIEGLYSRGLARAE